ncbi:MAG: family transcriptional regulator, cyclic receptor protein [Actinomycetota bacterium]|jgi:CRP-like cAMP-binding protein
MQRALLAACPRLDARAGEAVEVPRETDFLVVERGVVLSVVHAPNRRFVVSFAGNGDLVLSPADGIELEALRSSCLRAISRDVRKRLLLDPAAGDEVFAGLAAAVAEREQSLSQFAARLHDDRVLAKLVQLGRKFGRVTPDGIRLDLPLTHQLLADAVGSARETVSTTLRQLQRAGTIQRVGRTYLLKLPPHELA